MPSTNQPTMPAANPSPSRQPQPVSRDDALQMLASAVGYLHRAGAAVRAGNRERQDGTPVLRIEVDDAMLMDNRFVTIIPVAHQPELPAAPLGQSLVVAPDVPASASPVPAAP